MKVPVVRFLDRQSRSTFTAAGVVQCGGRKSFPPYINHSAVYILFLVL